VCSQHKLLTERNILNRITYTVHAKHYNTAYDNYYRPTLVSSRCVEYRGKSDVNNDAECVARIYAMS